MAALTQAAATDAEGWKLAAKLLLFLAWAAFVAWALVAVNTRKSHHPDQED